MKIFISSHGHFASGLKSSLEILFGTCESISVFDAYVDERSVKEQLDAFFETVPAGEQVLLVSDLYGSSVNQAMYLYLGRPNTTLVSGVNLAFMLGLAGRETVNRKELEELVAQSREMLKIVEFDQEDGGAQKDVLESGDDFF